MSKESGWTKLFSFLDTSSKSEMDEYDNPPIYFNRGSATSTPMI